MTPFNELAFGVSQNISTIGTPRANTNNKPSRQASAQVQTRNLDKATDAQQFNSELETQNAFGPSKSVPDFT